eukprot:COSAG02_NODE_3868_length_6119_cov_4.342857_3_plen_898_part_01
MTSSLPPCKDVFGDLWAYLETRNRVSVCPSSSVAFGRDAEQPHLVTLSLQPVTQPGRYWIRTFLQNREESPHFELDLMISGSQLNVTVVAAPPSPAETTFSLHDTTIQSGALLQVVLMPRDAFGNPTTIENCTAWRPGHTSMDRRSRLSGAAGAATVYLDSNDTRCSAKPATNSCATFFIIVQPSARTDDLLHVTLGGADVKGSPAALQIIPASCVVGCSNTADPCDSLGLGADWLLCEGSCIPALWCDVPSSCGAVDGFTSCTSTANQQRYQPVCYPDVDECMSAPCHNGDCIQGSLFSFRCECFPGFEGDMCEIDIDECASNPCDNNGTCTDSSTGNVALVSTACVPRPVCVQDDPCTQTLGKDWTLCASGACVLLSPWCDSDDPCHHVLGSIMYGRTCSRWGLTAKIDGNRGRRRTLRSRSQDFLTEPHRRHMIVAKPTSVATTLLPTLTQTSVDNFGSSSSVLGYYKSTSKKSRGNLANTPTFSAPRRVQESSETPVSGCVAQSACAPDSCQILGAPFRQCGESCTVRMVCDTCTQDGFVSECTLRTHQCARTPVPLSVPLLHRLAAAHITSPTTVDWGGVSGYWQCCEVIEQFSIEECIEDPEEPPSSKAFTITTHLSCMQGCTAVADAPYIWSYQPHWPLYVQSNSFTFAFDPEVCRSIDLESPCEKIGMVSCGEYCVPRPEGNWEVHSMAEQGLYSTAKKHCDPRGSMVADFAACGDVLCDCKHAHGGRNAYDECCVCGGNGTSCQSDPQRAEHAENNTGSYDYDYYDYYDYYDFSSDSGSWDDGNYTIVSSGNFDQSELWTDASSESESWSSDQLLDSENVDQDQCVPLSDDACTQHPGDRCRTIGNFVACRLTSSTVVQVDISFAIDMEVISESAEALHVFKQSVIVTI